jgi:hypothetical protein
MTGMVAWIAAEADWEEPGAGSPQNQDSGTKNPQGQDVQRQNSQDQNPHFSQNTREMGHPGPGDVEVPIGELPAHSFPAWGSNDVAGDDSWELERTRRIYRRRTVTMLQRYMRYSIETGRLPSLLGREFFRTQVTSYTVVTFEDRVIFVHDMERCLDRLDEFSRQLIARHILQEHDQAETGRLLNCTERTIRTYVPIALDLLSEILLEVGLLERSH